MQKQLTWKVMRDIKGKIINFDIKILSRKMVAFLKIMSVTPGQQNQVLMTLIMLLKTLWEEDKMLRSLQSILPFHRQKNLILTSQLLSANVVKLDDFKCMLFGK